MISFAGVSVTFPDAAAPALREVDLTIPEGALALVAGATGSGKSTLLRCINGLVPYFSGGRLDGRVVVGERDTRTHRPRDLADLVGYVGQDPAAGFVTDSVEDELAYAMESLGVAPPTMRRRVEETLDLLGLADVRDRPLLALSAGQQQRVAIGSVLTAQPRILVLDEPTSALDPAGAEEVLASLTRLVHDLGLTVVIAEHRLERVVQYADLVVAVAAGTVMSGAPAEVMATCPVAPPVVELGRLFGWAPLPLSVRDARRAAAGVRESLTPPVPEVPARGRTVLSVRGATASYGEVPALAGVDLTVAAGEVVAVMGRNGAGKSTLLAAIAGILTLSAGEVESPGRVALVPSDPADLLWSQTVAGECNDADRDAGIGAGATRRLLDTIVPGLADSTHPRDLSEGQRLGLALAVVLAGGADVVALDEPTRGLDYAAKQRLAVLLRGLANDGHGVVLSTHDVELAAEVADRVIVLADGEVVTDAPAREAVVGSPMLAPQVAKVFAPLALLTVADVVAALGTSTGQAS